VGRSGHNKGPLPSARTPSSRRSRNFLQTHPLQRKELRSVVELVIDATGALEDVGVVVSGGSSTFDAGAVASAAAALPLLPPPANTLSDDGRLYLEWEFHRREIYTCSAYFARA
jgi:TonB family protein